jgi:hypothetical protein
VIVHGINDDSRTVWSKSDGRGTWLKDKMFALRCVRVMTYGYDTRGAMADINTRGDIKETASRLLESLSKLRKEEDQVSFHSDERDLLIFRA